MPNILAQITRDGCDLYHFNCLQPDDGMSLKNKQLIYFAVG
jgi:hypothetical protein